MTDHSSMRLGKHLGVVRDPRMLELASYIDAAALPHAPARVHRSGSVLKRGGYPMYANDRLGDCTCAAAGHMELTWSHGRVRVEESDVVRLYNATGVGDTGRYELDVLNYWRKTGLGGFEIRAFARVDWRNPALLRAACWLFGGVYVGAALPLAAQSQVKWDVPKGQALDGPWKFGSWGGHAFHVCDYDEYGVGIVTWAETKRVSNRWVDAYLDEAYAIISPEWLHHEHGTESPQGFDLAALEADLAKL